MALITVVFNIVGARWLVVGGSEVGGYPVPRLMLVDARGCPVTSIRSTEPRYVADAFLVQYNSKEMVCLRGPNLPDTLIIPEEFYGTLVVPLSEPLPKPEAEPIKLPVVKPSVGRQIVLRAAAAYPGKAESISPLDAVKVLQYKQCSPRRGSASKFLKQSLKFGMSRPAKIAGH